MTSPTILGSAQPDLEGRSLRDIVEYSPEQVNEAWCRKILRKILQSLELQYAMQMPHRTITPDTIVFHANGEPLLISDDIDAAPAPAARLTDDLSALAGVLHYAITQELAPTGPLHGRAEGFSDALIAAIDACMAPDPARRPHDVEAVRALLGVVAPGPVMGAITLPDAQALAETPVPRAATPPVDTNVSMTLEKRGGTAAATPAAAHADSPTPTGAGTPAGAGDDADAKVLSAWPAAAAAGTRNVNVPPSEAASPTPPLTPAMATAPAAAPTAQVPRKPSAPDRAADAPVAASIFAGVKATPDPFAAPPQAGMRRGQRWAIAAGGGAIVIAVALMLFAEMRDSGSYDHVVLTLPQTGAGARPGAPAPGVNGVLGSVPGAGTAADALTDATGAGVPGALTTNPSSGAANGAAGSLANDATSGAGTGAATAAATETAAGATMGAASGAAPGGNLAASPASGASSGGATLGGGAEQSNGMTRLAPNPASATDSVADVPAPAPVPTTGNASYQLQIKPWGIVYVDGVDRGVSPPIKRLTLAPGRHTIRITNPNYRDSILEFDSAQATSNGKIIVDFNHEAQ